MDLQLTNKTALVTGSTAGIGFAIASLLAHAADELLVLVALHCHKRICTK